MSKIKSDAHIYLTPVDAAAPATHALSGITSATPPVVTSTAALPAGMAAGDFVVLDGTGEGYLDGDGFRVANLVGLTFALDYADGSRITPAVTQGNYALYSKNGTGAMLSACMASITVTGQAPDSITMDDMCGTSTVLGDAKPPTFTFSGFSDQDSEGYQNLWRAATETPKPTVWALFDFGADGGYIFGPVQIGEMTVTAQTNQGLQFSGAGVFTEMPTYSWAL